jgi:hypothetical protein
MFFYTGTTIALVTIDTSNGVVTPWTAYTGFTMLAGISARITSYNSNFWRVELTATGTAAIYIFRFLPAATANATQSTGVQDGTLQGSAVFANAQVELGSAATSYIPTTTVAVTRNADVLTYPSAGNIVDAAGWCSAEFQSPVMTTSNSMSIIGNSASGLGPLLTRTITSGVQMNDGVNQTTGPVGTPLNNTQIKAASTWSGSATLMSVGGVNGTAGVYDGAFALTAIGIGNAVAFTGTIRNVRIGQRQLSSSELQAITR